MGNDKCLTCYMLDEPGICHEYGVRLENCVLTEKEIGLMTVFLSRLFESVEEREEQSRDLG